MMVSCGIARALHPSPPIPVHTHMHAPRRARATTFAVRTATTMTATTRCLQAGVALVSVIFAMMKQSTIVAFLLVGVIAAAAGVEPDGGTLASFSAVGIILLLFMAGLEVEVEALIEQLRAVLTIGLGQICLNTALGCGMALLIGVEGGVPIVYFGPRGVDLSARAHGRVRVRARVRLRVRVWWWACGGRRMWTRASALTCAAGLLRARCARRLRATQASA